jgi:hypothetical protein
LPDDRRHRHDQQLGDTVTAFEPNLVGAMIDQQHLDLTPITRIDDARGVDQAHAVGPGMSASGHNQARITRRDGHRQAGGHGHPLTGEDPHRSPCLEIETGVALMSRAGRRYLRIEKADGNLHWLDQVRDL